MDVVGAIVFLKSILRRAVKCERGHDAFEARSGRVMSQGQWEQHQPVKSSPSTQTKRLLHLYLLRAFGIRARARRVEQHQ